MLAWGARVSPQFRTAVVAMCGRLGIDPNHMMACMAFETGMTFSPSVRNAAGSGAVGLIQFMPQTALVLGTTTEALASMPALMQLGYVEKYFAPRKNRLKTLSDVYMAILWPSAIGRSEDAVLFDKNDPHHPKRYLQNAGLDVDRNGKITKAEASARVAKMLALGLKEGNAA